MNYSVGTAEHSLSIINVCNYYQYYYCLYTKYSVSTVGYSLFVINECILAQCVTAYN